jgi:NAD(P)H-quinone oxidoreductase subunit 5
MVLPPLFAATLVLTPAVLMLAAALLASLDSAGIREWRVFGVLSGTALVCALLAAVSGASPHVLSPWISPTALGRGLAVLVQLLGTVIGAFSARYLEGEPGQRRYVAALAGVLAAVQLLLSNDHWALLLLSWALVGAALQHLLCFYPERPFALLAAHKKRLADRLADGLLMAAAGLAWWTVGSGSLADLWRHLVATEASPGLQASAVCLVLAVILRTALLPVHGWLIQVMEAPTPVSALLHAGVVNLGGFVLIRFAPLLDHALLARWLLVLVGLFTAVLAGLVTLTRISIKVRLAWSTVAQMGFMVLECGVGLYSLAVLHLIGHSLYKAQTFLAASTCVRQTRLRMLHGARPRSPISLLLAPAVTIPTVLLIETTLGGGAWPGWWSAVLGLAWAPLLWLPAHGMTVRTVLRQGLVGLLMAAGLTGAALLGHRIPFEIQDAPDPVLGTIALLGMALLYLCLVALQWRPQTLAAWRRWSYAGFYVDEFTTRVALRLWPARLAPVAPPGSSIQSAPRMTSDALR